MKYCKMRIDFARRALDELEGQWAKYKDINPFSISSHVAEDRLSYIIEINPTSTLPLPEWSLQASSVVHHLRGALDNVAWRLATLVGSPKRPWDIYFPIVDDETKWPRVKEVQLANVPDWAIEIIKSIQPFSTNDLHLAALGDLSNHDKHRELVHLDLPVRDMENLVDIKFRMDPPPGNAINNVDLTRDEPTGKIQLTIHTSAPIDRVKGRVAGTVGLALPAAPQPMPLFSGLRWYVQHIGQLIEQLETADPINRLR